jgi:hypothetical protein
VGRHTGVVDQHGDLGPVKELANAAAVGGQGQVGGEALAAASGRANLGGQRLERLVPSGNGHHGQPRRGQLPGELRPDAG